MGRSFAALGPHRLNFSSMLPPGAFRRGVNRLDVYELVTLARTARPRPPRGRRAALSGETASVADRVHGRRRPRRKGRAASDGERRQLAHAARHPETPPAAPAPGEWARLLCDGGSRGNPGPAAIAAVLLAPGGRGARQALGADRARHGRRGRVPRDPARAGAGGGRAGRPGRGPERLAARDRGGRGEAPADAALAALVREIRAAAREFSGVRWRWHPRGDNEAADELVRLLLWP